MIELDNNDLILFINTNKNKNNWRFENEIHIYRLKDKNYCLDQKIKEDRNGYKIQESYSGCFVSSKQFNLLDIKKLSGNRFISISNYGFRIYSLNNNNQYSLILMDTHLEGINKICEINENKFIFCTIKHYGASMGGPGHDYLLIEKGNIIKIGEKELNERIIGLNERKSILRYGENNDNFDLEKSKKLISSLKSESSFKSIFEYSTYGGSHNFSDYIIIKNKYFCILVDNYLLIFHLLDNDLTKRYTFLKNGEKNLYIGSKYNIRKWNNTNDNKFLLIFDDYIILFELNENYLNGRNVINLKIIGNYNFPNSSSLLTDEENMFYVKKDEILIY